MKLKTHLELSAWSYLAATIALLMILLTFEAVDLFGLIAGLLITLWTGYKSYSSFKKMKTVRGEQNHSMPDGDATPEQRVQFYQSYLWLSYIACPLLIALMSWDLIEVKTGVRHVYSLHEPLSWIYESFGFYYALFTTPIFSVAIVVGLWLKVHQEKGKLS